MEYTKKLNVDDKKSKEYFPTIKNNEFLKSFPKWKQNSLSYQTRIPKTKQKHLEFKGVKHKSESLGPFSLGITENMYRKLNPPETSIDLNLERKLIKINQNSNHYTWQHNPFERVVNSSIDEDNMNPFISFRSRAFYERSVDLSMKPGNNTREDRQNPIFFFVPSSNEYRHYKNWEK